MRSRGDEDVDALRVHDCARPSARRRARAARRSTRRPRAATCRARSEQRLAGLLVDRLDLAGRRGSRSPARAWRCCAPCAAAVRATAATICASSSSASWNCTAPTSASGAQRRRLRQRAAPAEVAVARHRARAADRVVEQRARRRGTRRSHPRPCSGHRNGTGATRCGASPREQQLALAQRLAHEPDVAHLEVAQPAVDELARRARGARRRGRAPRRARRRSPRVAASSAAPAPVIPPPTTSTSSSPEPSASSARRRAAGSSAPAVNGRPRARAPRRAVSCATAVTRPSASCPVEQRPQRRVQLAGAARAGRRRRSRSSGSGCTGSPRGQAIACARRRPPTGAAPRRPPPASPRRGRSSRRRRARTPAAR